MTTHTLPSPTESGTTGFACRPNANPLWCSTHRCVWLGDSPHCTWIIDVLEYRAERTLRAKHRLHNPLKGR